MHDNFYYILGVVKPTTTSIENAKFFFHTISMIYEKGSDCTVRSSTFYPERTLRQPVRVCTTSATGNTCMYSCDGNGKILEHVYYDALTQTGTLGDCSGRELYTGVISNGCTEYSFGCIRMEWDNYCQPTTTTTTTTTPMHLTKPRTTTVAPHTCRVGDAVKARYPDGGSYDAHIASIQGNTITVNWSDGDANHRHVAGNAVYKNGVPCQPGS